MRVLHVNDQTGYGGGEHQTWLLVKELVARRELEQHVLLRRGGVLEAKLGSLLPATNLHRIPAGPPALTLPFKCRKLVTQLRIDLVHAHSGRSSTAFAFLGKDVLRVAHRRIPDPPGLGGLKRLASADAVVCVSDAIRQGLLDAGLSKSSRPLVKTIYSSIDPPAPAGEAAQLLGRPCIGFCGHFRKHKGLDLLLKAVSDVLPELPGLRLYLVGEGKEEEELQAICRELGLESQVVFAPFQRDPAPWIQAFDLFVMPSREEGLGSVALLSQALGTPVLASRAGGIPEAVSHDESGWLVKPGSSRELADALRLLARDRALLERLAAGGRERILRVFNSRVMAGQTCELYESLRREPRAQESAG